MSVTAMRRLVIAAFMLVCAALPSTASAMSSRQDATEGGIVRAMNHYRAQYGLPALHTNRGLHRAAAAHSGSMLRSNVMSHGAFGARVRHYVHAQRVGENLAWMDKCDAAAIVRMWIHSAEHRKVMLTPGFRRVGVGRRSSPSVCFVTADFGSAN
jgi:uncharacterized protein YkwD